jgi:hypothetical protein
MQVKENPALSLPGTVAVPGFSTGYNILYTAVSKKRH